MKKILLWIVGLVAVLAGIGLVLLFWKDIVVVFRAVIGVFLAITGLVMMSVSRD